MFKHNPFAGVLPFRNGSGLVPTTLGGTVSLGAALVAVERAEQALAAARAQAKAAAKREGKSVRNLFAEGKFVARASAEKWCEESRREGERVMCDIFTGSVSRDSMDPNSPYHHLAKRLNQIRPDDWPAHVARMRAVMNSDNRELGAQSKAEAILAAGRRARMSADAAGEVPEPTGFAAKVIECGKRRRGEIE